MARYLLSRKHEFIILKALRKIENTNNEEIKQELWWSFNLTTKEYLCSEMFCNLCGINLRELKTFDFLLFVHPDHKNKVLGGLMSYINDGVYKECFPLLTRFGYMWIESEATQIVVNDKGEEIMNGTASFLDDINVIKEKNRDVELRMQEFVRRHTSVSDSLMNLLNKSNISDAINNVLSNLVDDLDGDRAYIFEYDTKSGTQSCIYEVVRNTYLAEKDGLQDIPMNSTTWWTEMLYKGSNIIACDDVNELPQEEREILRSQNIQSIIVAPLITKNGVGGYIGVDMVGRMRKWTDTDKEWFKSIANIISLSTELRKSEDAIHLDRERYMRLYNSMPIGFVRIKLIYNSVGEPIDYVLVDLNPIAKKFVDVSEADIVGKSGFEIENNSEFFRNKLSVFDQVLKTKKVNMGNTFFSNTNIYINYTLYATEDGEVVVLMNDNTTSVVATRALRKSEETLNNIYKNIPIGIEIYDKDGFLISVNEAEKNIFGFTDESEVLGVNLFDNPIIPNTYFEDLKNGRPAMCSFYYDFNKINDYYKSAFSGKKHIILRGSILYDADNNIENYLLIVLDNTEHLHASHKIHEFELLFNSIAAFSEVGLCQWNPYESTIVGTDQWFTNLSISKQEITDIMDAYTNTHNEDIVRIQKGFKDIIDGTISSFREEIRIQDGKDWKWLRCNYKVAEYIPEENKIEIIGINIDITELKNTEIKLIEAKSRAEESDRLKSAFLANMSHEIRTPLNAIVGFSDLIVESDDILDRQQYIAIIRHNNDLLLQLISDILDISKIESGSLDITPEVVDVDELCNEIVFSQSMKVEDDVIILFDSTAANCKFVADKNRVRQILTNLVGNAIKFTNKGLISIGYVVNKENIEFYVSDTGIGIAADKLPVIFDRFIKLNNFVSGTGLGLPICKSIVDKMGGRIWCESEPSIGSCFRFVLPYKNVDEFEDAPLTYLPIKKNKIKPEDMIDGKPTILVAEDTDSNYLLVSTILKNDYNLIRAYTGGEAISLFEIHAPKLVLMDMKMPEMGGVEATRKIKETDKETPIIMLTAFAYDNDRIVALEAGCCDFITKPIHPNELRAIIQKYIG